MTEARERRWVPDVVMPPGATIAELLEDRGITQADFALMLGRTEKNISQIVNGKAPVNHDTAIELERVLGVPSSFWNSAEASYRDAAARGEASQRLAEQESWAKGFPLKQMRDSVWIPRAADPADTVDSLLRFFGVTSPESWGDYWGASRRLAARMSTAAPANLKALTAWLRAGELAAQAVQTAAFNETAFRQTLVNLRNATTQPPSSWPETLQQQCAQAGIAVVFIRELPGIRCYAVSWWATPEKAVVEMCLRGKSDDQFWFSFFHEAGHLLLHGKRRAHIHDLDGDPASEAEANVFASNALIPPTEWASFAMRPHFSSQDVADFAQSMGIAPGVVVGRLQKEGLLPYNRLNGLKVQIDWGH